MRMRLSIIRPSIVPPPTVSISRRGEERLRAGHPWIYRSDIVSAEVEPGDLVRVVSERRRPLGLALWSSASQISLRMIAGTSGTAGATGPTGVDEREWLTGRLKAAIDYRSTLDIDATAWRVVNAEGDRLPGLIVDLYGDGPDRCLVVQTLCQGMDRRLPLITELLAGLLGPRGILARNDPKVRRLEGLDERVDVVFGDVPETLDVREGRIRHQVDLRHGQKTGLFLDQRENRQAAARYARGRALDAFTYHGGFALQIAASCTSVLAIDSSAPAVAATRENALRHGLANIEVREANVFDELRELEIARERFDTIVLDPPAFAKNKASVERALAGYKEINLRALKLLSPGGCLITCSCSYNVEEALFLEVLADAAADARATVVLVETRMQARDHPVLIGVPETHYLKCCVLKKVG
jgi:23S rRNA (cytosine1962-C5)-methyltransferase